MRFFTIWTFLIVSIISCVGTVQETQKEITYGEQLPSNSYLSFGGVSKIIPISHNKLEVYFYPASGGSDDYSYLIYNSESDQPITVNEQSIFRAFGGLYMYTLSGLEQGRLYSIRVDAKDNEDGTVLQTDKYIEEKTFSDRVASFQGISTAQNAPGVAGLDSIIVSWPQADIPTSILEEDYVTKEYRIIVLDSTNKGATPNQLHDRSVTKEEGRIVYSVEIPSGSEWIPLVDNYTVTGLQENSVYYVGVQCLHKASVDDPNYPDLFGERNNRWIQIKTLTSNFENVSLDSSSFIASAASGAQAYSSINVQWGSIEAVYDHLRIYYAEGSAAENGACNSGSCKKILSNDSLSTTLADLKSLTEYEVKLVVCADATCDINKLLGTTTATTSPNAGTFNGILSVIPPQDITELGSFTVNYSTPDFSAGYFEGLQLYYVEPGDNQTFVQWQSGENVVPTLHTLKVDPINSISLYHEYFDMNLQTSFVVYGVSSNDPDDQHCFALVPYNTDASAQRVNLIAPKSAIWKCSSYNPQAPTSAAFSGLTLASTIQNQITIEWDTPTTGLYTYYAVFMKKGGASFNYSEALSNFETLGSSYDRILLPIETLEDGEVVPLKSYTIPSLENDTYYLGLRTLYMANGEYSESEDDIYKCVVNSSNDASINCELEN